jgi:hypothetical protein
MFGDREKDTWELAKKLLLQTNSALHLESLLWRFLLVVHCHLELAPLVVCQQWASTIQSCVPVPQHPQFLVGGALSRRPGRPSLSGGSRETLLWQLLFWNSQGAHLKSAPDCQRNAEWVAAPVHGSSSWR